MCVMNTSKLARSHEIDGPLSYNHCFYRSIRSRLRWLQIIQPKIGFLVKPGAAAVEYLICPNVCRSSSATGDFSSWGSIRLSVYPQIFGAGRPFLLVIQACSGDLSLQAFCSGNRTDSLEPILYLCQMLSQRILVVVIFPFIPPEKFNPCEKSQVHQVPPSFFAYRSQTLDSVPSSPPRKIP